MKNRVDSCIDNCSSHLWWYDALCPATMYIQMPSSAEYEQISYFYL